jgi:hypothetical protein
MSMIRCVNGPGDLGRVGNEGVDDHLGSRARGHRTLPRAATGHTTSTAPRRTPCSSSTMLLTTQQ